MDKPLPDKDKKEDRAGGYDPALTEKSFEEAKHRALKDTPQGRAAIRLFSRGIMGAAFFTAGGLLNRRWMHANEESLSAQDLVREGKYDATKGFLEQKNPLQFIAKTIDTFVGKPIEFAVTKIAGKDAGKNAIRFRPTKFKDMEHALWEKDPARGYYRGRSLGNETVAVTFDFFCASIGDAIGRDVADLLDPHVEKKWLKGGHVDFGRAAKSMAQSAWRYISYNGGEDWAVAIPYVYFMKGQRAAINHFSPGFMYDFDRNLNGGSFKVDQNGRINGNYNIEGLIDLQNRFVVYNMGTLMYRELYDYTARKMQGKNAVLWGAPDRDTSHETIGQKISNIGKWMVRSVIKGGIYMTPATPFFWITRTPQTNYRGLFIHTDHTGKAMTLNYENQIARSARERWLQDKAAGKPVGPEIYPKYENVYASELQHSVDPYKKPTAEELVIKPNRSTGLDENTPVYWSSFAPDPKKCSNSQFEWVEKKWHDGPGVPRENKINPIIREFPFHAYDDRTHDILHRGLNQIGRANYRLAHVADGVAAHMDNASRRYPRIGNRLKKILGLKSESFRRFMHPFINASVSYTPYMYMKAELGKLWDTGKMDYALERTIDGAANLNWNQFRAGVSDTTNAILHQPFTDPDRDKEGDRRTAIDTSQSVSTNRTTDNGNGKHELSWRERTISGKKPDIAAHENNPKGHAEREEMRKALEELQPPTNSIN